MLNVSQTFDQTSRENRSPSTFQDTVCIPTRFSRARVLCKYMHTQRTDFHSSLAVAFYLPHFLLCLLRGFLRYPRSPSPMTPQSSFPTESSTASGLAHRAESNSLVTLVGVSSRGPTNGINGQLGWQVKFSPEFNSMAPLNSR